MPAPTATSSISISQAQPSSSLPEPMQPRLVLASTSPYRRALLTRLRLAFDCVAPEVDETPRAGESPAALAERLAMAKAQEVSQRHPDAVVIGSDQVADLDGQPLGKPGDHAGAVAQLQALQGRRVAFHTAVAVLRPQTGYSQTLLATVVVRFRMLSAEQIEHYLQLEQPYDCAGSAKCEALGISLLQTIDSDDPTTLEGLPLMRTCSLLQAAGIEPLRWAR